jgi:hypothetical protein
MALMVPGSVQIMVARSEWPGRIDEILAALRTELLATPGPDLDSPLESYERVLDEMATLWNEIAQHHGREQRAKRAVFAVAAHACRYLGWLIGSMKDDVDGAVVDPVTDGQAVGTAIQSASGLDAGGGRKTTKNRRIAT